jgi:DNA polymerase-4
VQKLIANFGKKLGLYFHNAANGIDSAPVKESGAAESISRISTLKENTRELSVILENCNQSIEEIQKEIMQKNISFKQIGIIAVMTDLSVRSRSRTIETYTNKAKDLERNVRDLFQKFLVESELEIRRVGVKISHFAKVETNQKELTSFFQSI